MEKKKNNIPGHHNPVVFDALAIFFFPLLLSNLKTTCPVNDPF